jgi:hypothetical protein
MSLGFWLASQPLSTNSSCIKNPRRVGYALRMANAYYSRNKGALLFGYFPGTEDRRSGQFPGGIVFTCRSHDVVAYETTHALLDGFHFVLKSIACANAREPPWRRVAEDHRGELLCRASIDI